MKRLVVVLSSLLVLPAFAEVAPVYYDEEIEFIDTDAEADDDVFDEENTEAIQPSQKKQNTTVRNNARPVSTNARTQKNARTGGNSRTITTRSTNPNTRAVVSRVQSRENTTKTTQNRGTSTSSRRSTNTANQTVRARAGSVLQTSNTSLYNPNSVTPRISTRSFSTSSRNSTIRSATSGSAALTSDDITSTTAEMDSIKELTDYCKAQFASCMDNYCNVLDENQGRCSCSKNIANYSKTAEALENATEALQDIARQIQYIGLSGNDIETLFTQTEAEIAMEGTSDTSAIKSSLDKVKNMIINIKPTSTSSNATTNGMTMDLSGLLDFSFDSSGFDISSFLGTTNNTQISTISNQRGQNLYKSALARCRTTVLDSCTSQGLDASVITNAYDLEIDKACIAYEKNLTEANKNMAATVANAKEVLKKARLMVAQNKNVYDLAGCVSALDTCMQGDYVCGSDYESCLDPTGKYIYNGEVVIGSMPGYTIQENADINNNKTRPESFYNMWKSSTGSTDDEPWGTNWSLQSYVNNAVTKDSATNLDTDNMAKFLVNRIGYHDDKNNKDYGMCISVLNQCQKYTYDSKGKYDFQNQVIKEYLTRALVQIKASQDELFADYAQDCISNVSSCLSSNGFDASDANTTKNNVAINSCRSQIVTCMSVNGLILDTPTPTVMRDWVNGVYTELPIYESDDEISDFCSTITEEDSCNATAEPALCKSGTGTTKITVKCAWDTTNNECKKSSDVCPSQNAQ